MKNSTRALIAAAAVGAIALTTSVLSSTVRNTASATATAPRTKTDNPAKPLWHCGMHPQVIQDHPGFCPICHMALTPLVDHQHSISGGAGTVVSIDPTVVQNMGVRTATAIRAPLNRTLRAVGVFKLPEPAMHDVSLRVSGWIEKLYADQEGMHVVKGEPLFDLYSPDLQIAEQELITATKTSNAVGEQEGKGLVESARRKLQLWGIADQDVDAIAKSQTPPKTLPIRSPATGHVEDKAVVQGSAVAPMTKVMRIVDHTKMWLDAQIYQDDFTAIRLGDAIHVTVDGMPGKHFDGKITFISPHLDHMSRTLTVRTTIDNPDFALRPGMFGSAQIMEEPILNALQIPREAVIDTGTRQIVFLDQGDGHFAARPVHAGAPGDGDKLQILQGLSEGDQVVTSGQFLLDAESRTVEAIAKFTPATSEDKSSPTTQPASRPTLSVAYCPMARASWLQNGNDIANPYMGHAMSDCGNIKTTLSTPTNPAVEKLLAAYLDVSKSLNADRIDPAATKALASHAAALSGEQYAPLRESTSQLRDAKNIDAARTAFHELSDQLIDLLEHQSRGAAR